MPQNLLQAYAIKKPAFVFGVEDLMAVRDNPNMRLTATPFVHNYEDTVFLGHAAPWKGAKGIEAVRSVNPGVAAGLERAISISKSCAGEKGVVRVGDRYLPKKVICQIEKAGKKA
jgi:hypothetical protein